MAEFQEAATRIVGLIALLASIFLIGNSVSDPSSLIQTLESFNQCHNNTMLHDSSNSTGSAVCTPRHLAGHFKMLAYDVHFLAVSIALSAAVVYAVKMRADAAAKAEQEARETEAAAASAAEVLSSLRSAEAEEKEDALRCALADEAHAKLTAAEKRSAFNLAVEAASMAECRSIDAHQALQDAAAELETSNATVEQAVNTPGAEIVAAESNALAVAKAADDATTAAEQAKVDAAKAADDLQATIKSLDEADAEATRMIGAARLAKDDADAARKIADVAIAASAAAKPLIGIARLPGWKRVTLRWVFSFAIIVSLYSSLVAIYSFRELLKYKTECLGIDDPKGLKSAIMAVVVPAVNWLLGLVFAYLHLSFLWVAIMKN